MPLHEYVCRGCEHRFEALVAGERSVQCPRCGSTSLSRQLSSFAVRVGTSRSRVQCAEHAACGACCEGAGPAECPLR